MIITYKVRHNLNISEELFSKARQVAEFSIANRDKRSSKDVKHIGLKSAISCQIIRKYGRNRRCKTIKNVNLIIPSQSCKIKAESERLKLRIVPLNLFVDISYLPKFIKLNQVELSKEFAFIYVTIKEKVVFSPTSYVGCDRNATSHIAVLANPSTGKVTKLGKKCSHIHNKYRNIRANAQKNKAYKFVKKLGKREANIIRDINHKISKKIIQHCFDNKAGLVLEDLKNIRKNKKSYNKKLNGIVHSWSFYQLESFLTYKALRYGIPIFKVDPQHTSQLCSKCGNIGTRKSKEFQCQHCGHTDHADVNAAFNIAQRHMQSQSLIDRDIDESLPIFLEYKTED